MGLSVLAGCGMNITPKESEPAASQTEEPEESGKPGGNSGGDPPPVVSEEPEEDDSVWPNSYTVTLDFLDMTFTGTFIKEGETAEGYPIFVMRFDDAGELRRPFSLFGTEYTERWTLNLTMERVQTETPYKLDGVYEGEYTIDVQYDLAALPSDFLNIGPTGHTWNTVSAPIYNMGATLDISAESNSVWRTIEGKARAFLWRDPVDGTCSITPWESRNDKNVFFSFDVSVTGIAVHGPSKTTTRADYMVTSDENRIDVMLTGNHTVIEAMGIKTEVGDIDVGADTTVMWNEAGDIWHRGDNADSFWKITLLPAG
jgi:hypothetical protein